MDPKLFAAVPGVCRGDLGVDGHRLKYETLQGLVIGGVSDAEIMRKYEFVTAADLDAIRERPAMNAIKCFYCHAEVESRSGWECVTHTCDELKIMRGPKRASAGTAVPKVTDDAPLGIGTTCTVSHEL